ncbi:MAG: amidophosphoribosyltransferase [Bacteroidales bacterium]|nr:amidophosphoribosyltransferase [Bacteroidales bacterium]
MSDSIKHECGIALIRLRKPLEFYQIKYGDWRYGLEKLYLLMEKQHNRGQDGAGMACIKVGLEPGKKYIFRHRSNNSNPIQDIFDKINNEFKKVEEQNPERLNDPGWAKNNLSFAGELLLGHLRYGTFGNYKIDYVHPVKRENNWKSRNLVLAGNFNLTNVEELFQELIDLGQIPKDFSDTVTILENLGHFLDQENQILFEKYKKEGYLNKEISPLIEKNISVTEILRNASKRWDGGYAMAGLLGHGDAFVARDPWGIRPAYYYYDDEVVVVASERPVIQTVFNVPYNEVEEIPPGYAVISKNGGEVMVVEIRKPELRKSCSFERIYFSRGSDRDIYQERLKLGEFLTPQILKVVDYDLENTVFSFIPNTAETAFYGMIRGAEKYLGKINKEKILQLKGNLTAENLDDIIAVKPRVEKIAVKDVKLRTFIAGDSGRDDLVGHVYDITYGTIREGKDKLVIIDDSIVRGTTLKYSIIRILDRLRPWKIVVVSSSPQIRYPDCYGIDMAKLSDFIAFKAAIQLLKDTGKQNVIDRVYNMCKEQEDIPKEKVINYVREIYEPFTPEQISGQIARMLKTNEIRADLEIVYQSIENLHKAIPEHTGDWYFTGNYPTPGGNKVVNQSFINFIEGKNKRAY